MSKDFYDNSSIKKLFEANQIKGFDELWALKTPWFEEPNQRRNGWSGVIKLAIKDENGNKDFIFIKRQENHNHKTFFHPIKGVPTFRREFYNIKKLNKAGIPSLTGLFYGERQVDAKIQSILVTRSLEGYQSLEEFALDSANDELPQRAEIMQVGGIVVRRLHNAHFRHNCLYAKHLFVKVDNDNVDVRLIDLEKLKYLPFTSQIRRNDLSRFIRRCHPLKKNDVEVFIQSYLSYGSDLNNSSIKQTLDTIMKEYLK